MKGLKYFAVFLPALMLAFGWGARAEAYTETDYYNWGAQSYAAKNYSQAVPYFNYVLSLDPNNLSALKSRGNCYYFLGQYPQALADYQKVQGLQPNDQVASFIQALQTKINTAPAALGLPLSSTPAPSSPAATGSFDQGMGLYQQKQYQAALPMFQQAVLENPNDARAYYYLGVCQSVTGDTKDAVVNLTRCDKLRPNAAMESYLFQLREKLTPEDQQWVDSQTTVPGTISNAGVSAPKADKNFGIRLEPAFFLAALGDFNMDAQTSQKATAQQQQSDPSLGYTAAIPSGYFGGGLEPVVKLGSSFEIGLPFAILPIGTITDTTQDANGYNATTQYNLSAFSIGLDGWYFIPLGKEFQLFACAGPLFVPISIAYTGTTTNPGITSTQSGTFSSTGFGGQIQAGFDWHMGDTFVISPMVGYQWVTADAFQGTLSASPTVPSAASGPGQLEVIPTSNGNAIEYLANNQTAPAGSRALQVDLSGLKAGLQISVYF